MNDRARWWPVVVVVMTIRVRYMAVVAVAVVATLLVCDVACASTCTWTGATNSNWSQNGNWSTGACGGGPPASGDVASFTAGSAACTLNADATAGSVTINGYTGTITQASGAKLTTTGGFTQATGTFIGGNSTIKIGGAFSLSAGAFTSTSGRLEVVGQFNKSGGTFTHNNGQVMLAGTADLSFLSNGATFYDLTINDGLMGYWPLDEGANTALSDRSGYGNDGTGTNTNWVTASTDVPTLNFRDPAALSFNGSSSSASLGVTSFPALNGAQTLSMWVYYSALPGAQQTVASIVAGANQVNLGFVDVSGAKKLTVFSQAGTSLAQASTTPASGWHHLAYVYDGASTYLYVDGTAYTTTGDPASGTVTALYLGARNGASEFFSGRIDDVRLYKRVLTATEISALVIGNLPGATTYTQTLSGSPTIDNNLALVSGTLAAGTNAIAVKGNWRAERQRGNPRRVDLEHSRRHSQWRRHRRHNQRHRHPRHPHQRHDWRGGLRQSSG